MQSESFFSQTALDTIVIPCICLYSRSTVMEVLTEHVLLCILEHSVKIANTCGLL